MSEFDGDGPEDKLLQEAEELMRQKRFQDAASRYRNLRQYSPTDLWASLGYASALELAGKVSEAEQILEEAVLSHHRSAPLHRFRRLFFERREDPGEAATSVAALHAAALEEGPEDQLADLYFNQGRYHEALAELERLVRDGELGENELRASVLARIGACLRQNSDFDGARLRLEEAIDLDSSNHWILSELAEVERALGDIPAARRRYQEALDANPDDHWCRGHLAQMECEDGNIDRGVELYRQILAAMPKAAWAKVELAQVITERDPAESATLCAAALDDDPTYPWAHAQLGNLARRAGELDQAREHYRQALSGSSSAAWILHELADICRHLGRMQEAYTHLEHARGTDPYDATTYGYFADLLRHEGKHGSSMANLEKAVELDGAYTWAWRELAELRALAGKHGDADAAYQKAVELEPDEAINDGLMAFLLRCQGRRDQALPWLARAVERQKDYVWAWREQIDYHLSRGRAGDAEDAARRALVALPESAPMLGLLAETLRRQGRPEEAREQVQRALELAPDAPQLHALAAELSAEIGDSATAQTHAARAVELDQAPEYRALRAQILIASGDLEAAKPLVRELLQAKEPIAPAFELAAVVADRSGDVREAATWCDRGLSGAHAGETRLLVRRARFALTLKEADPTDRLLPLFEHPATMPWRDCAQLFAQDGRPALARRAAYIGIAAADDGASGDARAERRAKAWLNLAELELGMGNGNESEQALAQALSYDPDCVPARILGAVLCEQSGDLAGAIAHLEHLDRRLHTQRAGEDDPARESALLLRQLAWLYERNRQGELAASAWKRILAMAGDDDGHRCEHALWLLRRGELEADQRVAEVLATAAPSLAEWQRLIREFAAGRSGPATGLAVLRARANDLDAGNRALAAQLALAAGDAAQALELAAIALGESPGDRTARVVRVRALIAARHLDVAEPEARELVREAADDEEAAVVLAECLALAGRCAEALAAVTPASLPGRPGAERGQFIALLALEVHGEAAFLAALGRAPVPTYPAGIARIIAAAYPGAWMPLDPAHPATMADALSLPPFPSLARRLARALAHHGRMDLAATLVLGVAEANTERDPAATSALCRQAVPWLRQLGRRRQALVIAWREGQWRETLACLWPW